MSLHTRLLPLLALLAVGVLARWAGVLHEPRRDALNAVAFYVALPALVFDSTLGRSPGEIASRELVAGVWLVLGVAVVLAWLVHRRVPDGRVRGVATVQSYHGNMGYLGLPLVAATLGGAAAGKATVVLGVGALAQIPITVWVLGTLTDADAGAAATSGLREVATNPVVLSLVVALVATARSVPVPDPFTTVVGHGATLALPLALVLVGSALEPRLPDEHLDAVGAGLALKLVVVPAVAWLAFTALGADESTRAAGVLMLGAPAAVSTFVYAKELGGDASFASVGVFTSTVASVLTLGFLVTVVL